MTPPAGWPAGGAVTGSPPDIPTTRWAGAGPGEPMAGRFAYGDRMSSWTDPGGALCLYQLDASSRVTSVTSPLGDVTHFWYDDAGQVTGHADPLGRLTL